MKKHIRKVPNNKKAIAPYNFVELPDKIVSAELESNGKLRDNNRYYSDRYTGKIECTLTTSSPLYIRCGLTKEEFECGTEAKDLPDFYYIDKITKKPVLPGSSLRGMLRTLVEIISFSKISPVSDYQRLFFRAVATLPREDSLATAYREFIPSKVKAGYLKQDGDTLKIHAAKKIRVNNTSTSFAWVKEEDLSSDDFPELKKFDDADYLSQDIPISFHSITKAKGRYIVEDVTIPKKYPLNQGRLVTSGNMKETSDSDSESIRTYHCVVFAPSPNPNKTYTIDPEAINNYLNALTDFQKQPPFDEKLGMLQENRPVFYCQPTQGNIVTLFGHSPNFRIPYSPNDDGKAATVVDFIPENLRDDSIIDIAEAIFGFVRRDKSEEKEQSRAGRIFVSDAICLSSANDIFMTQDVITPKILASPKPTTHQHYLVQPEETNAEKSKLKHYASQPTEETVIRGHKLYWHKGSNPDIQHPKPNEVKNTQTTQIQPIKSGVKFQFTIQFENLSRVEIGALMWIINIAQNNDYRLSLGMGKPLGMGAVKIENNLYISKRQARYTQLFNNNSWATAESLDDNRDYQLFFENYILQELKQTGRFNDIPRIQMLLTMLSWQSPPLSKTRYMEIEREQNPLDGEPNEYKNRRVLPTPLDVIS
ncbi:TIGR03986 family CRISPR-associated RAMP protein [uncultured Nostoc sp.]|uniref:TIGR03986 family type III CRISPR-associated RAMP protein n=1 Tax=uncultured Nostoc sp. TaxID=340711 RepID=UPI0035CB105E